MAADSPAADAGTFDASVRDAGFDARADAFAGTDGAAIGDAGAIDAGDAGSFDSSIVDSDTRTSPAAQDNR